MKILHVWDPAGVASILAKHQRFMGHDVTVLMSGPHDTLGISEFYGNAVDISIKRLLLRILTESRRYDVIHIHNLPILVPPLRLLHPTKKIFIHHHGFTSAKKPITPMANRMSSGVFVSTSDLLGLFPDARLLPTPVDTDHFTSITTKKNGDKQLAFHMRYLDLIKFKAHVADPGTINIIDREATPTPYGEMPSLLRRYSILHDVKYLNGVLLKAHSKTCWEALACGVAVVGWDGVLIQEFPREHDPQSVAKQCLEYYES